jgi:hypothetical protein
MADFPPLGFELGLAVLFSIAAINGLICRLVARPSDNHVTYYEILQRSACFIVVIRGAKHARQMPHGMWRMRRTIYFEDKKIQNGTS